MPNCASIIEAIVGGEVGFVETVCCAVVVRQAASRAKTTVVDRTRIRERWFWILITALNSIRVTCRSCGNKGPLRHVLRDTTSSLGSVGIELGSAL
jgi:hypothetical protein